MEKELVQDRGWLSKQEMRDAIAVSQSLPGPLAIQVGIFAAYPRGGFWGAWAGGWALLRCCANPTFAFSANPSAPYLWSVQKNGLRLSTHFEDRSCKFWEEVAGAEAS
jgi:chromate transporter